MLTEAPGRRSDVRSRIVDVAAHLLREHGPAAVTTRGVAEGAGVQAPTIYRLFGDKDGLLDAVAEHALAAFVAGKEAIVRVASADGVDPLEDLRAGWEMQIEFGLTNPAVFRLLSDPGRVVPSPAAQAGLRVLAARVHRVAVAGRLRVGEQHAVNLVHAAGTGTLQTLLATPAEHRDARLAASMFEAVCRQILTEAPDRPDDPLTAASVALRAVAPRLDALSDAERHLLTEWLDRLVHDAPRSAGAAPVPPG